MSDIKHIDSSNHNSTPLSKEKILGDNYKKVFLITINHSNAGFFAYLTFVINQLIYCEKHNYLPVVNFSSWSKDGPNAFYEPSYGENTWDYYFEPVASYTYDEIKVIFPSSDIIKLSVDELWYLHLHEPNSLYNYPYGCQTYHKEKIENWYKKQRQKAHSYIKRYIKIKPHILNEVNIFYKKHFLGQHVLGVHIRGTDKGLAGSSPQLMRIVKPKEYFPLIDNYIKKHIDCKIFVATDQKQFLEEMKEYYQQRIIHCNGIRSDSFINPFQQKKGSNYIKGVEVLTDCLLLSKCNFLLKCSSAVGEYAIYFNPDLACIDLNHYKKGFHLFNLLKMELTRARQKNRFKHIKFAQQKNNYYWKLLKLYLFYNRGNYLSYALLCRFGRLCNNVFFKFAKALRYLLGYRKKGEEHKESGIF